VGGKDEGDGRDEKEGTKGKSGTERHQRGGDLSSSLMIF